MIDQELIESKIDIILENLDYLENVKKVDEEEFLNSYEKIQATKHSLQEAIEASLDISNHIISAKNWNRAETYAKMFERLQEYGVINKDLEERLSNMARFRNILVHRYGKIDNKRIFKILNENSSDMYDFIKRIEKFLDEED